MSTEHKKRWIAGMLGVVLLFGTYFLLGHWGLVALTVAISTAAYLEFLEFSGASKELRWASAGAGFLLSAWLSAGLPGPMVALYLAALAVLLRALWQAHRSTPDALAPNFLHAQARVFGLVYLIFFPSFFPKVHALPHGPALVLFLLLIVWTGDVAAYYGGKLLGRHKLSANVSPGKTLEGSATALVATALMALLYGHFALGHPASWKLAVIAVLTSIVAQAGDLVESQTKRAFHVKDSGALIPGHGGVFDRFDSLILAAPFFYLLLRLGA